MEFKILYSGSSTDFLKRMSAFSETLPELIRRIDGLKLSKSRIGLRSLNFVEKAINGERFFYDRSNDSITVNPLNFRAGDRIDQVVFRAFGHRHWHLNIPSSKKIEWAGMYVTVPESLIDRLAPKLRGKNDFKDAVSSFNNATERLIVIHIVNALTKNSVTPSQLSSIDFRTHPSVSDFVHGKRPFSLRPLVSTYGGDVKRLGDYAEAFSEYCAWRGTFKISESSTREAFKELFLSVSGH